MVTLNEIRSNEVAVAPFAPDDVLWFVQSSIFRGFMPTLDDLVEVIADLPELVAANLPEHDLAGAASIALRVEHVVNAPMASAA